MLDAVCFSVDLTESGHGSLPAKPSRALSQSPIGQVKKRRPVPVNACQPLKVFKRKGRDLTSGCVVIKIGCIDVTRIPGLNSLSTIISGLLNSLPRHGNQSCLHLIRVSCNRSTEHTYLFRKPSFTQVRHLKAKAAWLLIKVGENIWYRVCRKMIGRS